MKTKFLKGIIKVELILALSLLLFSCNEKDNITKSDDKIKLERIADAKSNNNLLGDTLLFGFRENMGKSTCDSLIKEYVKTGQMMSSYYGYGVPFFIEDEKISASMECKYENELLNEIRLMSVENSNLILDMLNEKYSFILAYDSTKNYYFSEVDIYYNWENHWKLTHKTYSSESEKQLDLIAPKEHSWNDGMSHKYPKLENLTSNCSVCLAHKRDIIKTANGGKIISHSAVSKYFFNRERNVIIEYNFLEKSREIVSLIVRYVSEHEMVKFLKPYAKSQKKLLKEKKEKQKKVEEEEKQKSMYNQNNF